MRCPFCGNFESKVTDSRTSQDFINIKRRRECLKCKNRFTTFETIDLIIQVEKRDGTYEDFDQEKLKKGLTLACMHSKVSHDEIRSLVSKIVSSLLSLQIKKISAKKLGEMVMENLQKLDMVAYIRFACVYKRFKDIDEVEQAIKKIKDVYAT